MRLSACVKSSGRRGSSIESLLLFVHDSVRMSKAAEVEKESIGSPLPQCGVLTRVLVAMCMLVGQPLALIGL
jgi:hypothetical protein